jgi:hypothetical protein
MLMKVFEADYMMRVKKDLGESDSVISSQLLEHIEEDEPEALQSIPSATINRYLGHCMRLSTAYREGIQYGTNDFQ